MKTNNHQFDTTLGFPLVRSDDVWEINLMQLKIFSGLSVLAAIISEHIIEIVETNPGDVSFLYRINPNINPELIEMNIVYIQVYARAGVLKESLLFKKEFQEQLVTVFGTFQRPNWFNVFVPEFNTDHSKENISNTLVFPFHNTTGNIKMHYQVILEREKLCNNNGGYLLRLLIEDANNPTYNLERIPHVIVDDLESRVYISGSTRISESIRDGILNVCNRGMKFYSRENRPYSNLFEQLEHTKLGRLEQINFNWEKDFIEYIHNTNSEVRLAIFKKLFLSLEDDTICKLLNDGGTIKINLGAMYFSLYLSQLARVLNISINLPRKIFHSGNYLKRMPILESLVTQNNDEYDFKGINVFLIHHITSEVIAFIEALKKLQADSLHVLFVKYGGKVPSTYLDALLENSTDFLFATGLTRKMTEQNQDYYTLAKYFSDTSSLQELDMLLDHKKLNFFEAMKLVAGHNFLKYCMDASLHNKKVLLIEDGGYLAPFLNDFALQGKTTAEVFSFYRVDTIPDAGSFADWLQKILIGTVEHTKNGYDRLNAISQKHSGLKFPAFSIAISDIKVKEEAREVAHSILSAVESILHENGMILSRRNIIVFGADGNIGKCLCRYLEEGRLHKNNKDIVRVDSKYHSNEGCYALIDDIPETQFLSRDLFVGLIGDSILKKNHIERLILNGTKQRLVFASGSTKTVEFADLSDWLYEISILEHPQIRGIPVHIMYDRIYDPQSGIDQGGKVSIQFEIDNKLIEKELYLLSDLSPVNFLYYGVPTEAMDIILSQLLTVSLGLVDKNREGSLPCPGLYAVDHEIDEWGNVI